MVEEVISKPKDPSRNPKHRVYSPWLKKKIVDAKINAILSRGSSDSEDVLANSDNKKADIGSDSGN